MLLKCLISTVFVRLKISGAQKNEKWHLMHFCVIHSIARLFVYMREKISQVFYALPRFVLVES